MIYIVISYRQASKGRRYLIVNKSDIVNDIAYRQAWVGTLIIRACGAMLSNQSHGEPDCKPDAS